MPATRPDSSLCPSACSACANTTASAPPRLWPAHAGLERLRSERLGKHNCQCCSQLMACTAGRKRLRPERLGKHHSQCSQAVACTCRTRALEIRAPGQAPQPVLPPRLWPAHAGRERLRPQRLGKHYSQCFPQVVACTCRTRALETGALGQAPQPALLFSCSLQRAPHVLLSSQRRCCTAPASRYTAGRRGLDGRCRVLMTVLSTGEACGAVKPQTGQCPQLTRTWKGLRQRAHP